MTITKEVIKAYALENAQKYKGKANSSAVLSGLFAEGLEKSQIKDFMPLIQEIILEVNQMNSNSQRLEFEKLKNIVSKREIREGLPLLPHAKKGEVVMRMAPFPTGALHLGNSRPLILNDQYAKDYLGTFYLVMDDTIGSEKKQIQPEAYKLIEDAARWLGCNIKEVLYKSDRIQQYYKYAEELLKKGYMYVCSCPAEDFRELKIEKKDCPCRNNSPEKNLSLWKKMLENAPEGSLAVRLKTSMSDPDPAFRDRVMFRISERIHPKLGNKFRVYPTMEFSWAIDNHIWGITHIIRGIELDIEGKVEEYVRNLFGWSNPIIIHNGHLVLEGVKLSKSKGLQEVKSGAYRGWDDPRLWSIQSLRARGIKPEAIREFILSQGVKQSNTTVPVDVLYKINKKYIENSSRYFFIEDPIKIKINGSPEIKVEIPLHPDRTKGFKKYNTSQEFYLPKKELDNLEEGNYRLMHLFNFKSFKLDKNLSNFDFSFISKDPDPKLQTKYLHWLPANYNNIYVEVIMDDGSILKGLAEPEISKLDVGEIIQFERFGFVRINKKEKNKIELFFAHK